MPTSLDQLRRLEYILRAFDSKIDRNVEEFREMKYYRRLPRRLSEEDKILIKKFVYLYRISPWDKIKSMIEIRDNNFNSEGAKWVAYLLLSKEDFERMLNEGRFIIDDFENFVRRKLEGKYSERYIKSVLKKIKEGKIEVGYLYSFVGRKSISKLKRLGLIGDSGEKGWIRKYSIENLRKSIEDFIKEAYVVEERSKEEGKIKKALKLVVGIPYAAIAGTASVVASFVRNIYEVLAGGLLEEFQYPKRLWEMFQAIESLGKDISDEEGNSPNVAVYTVGKAIGNFIDSTLGAIIFGPAGAAVGGLSMANAILTDAGNLARIVLDLYKKVGKKIGVKYPLKAKTILDRYMKVAAWSYQVIDKTISLLDKNIREWLKSIYPELNGDDKSKTLEDVIKYYYDQVRDNRIRIKGEIEEKLREFLRTRFNSEEKLKEILKKVINEIGEDNLDFEALKKAYAIAVLQMYNKLSEDQENMEKAKEALALLAAASATPFYILYRWARGSAENFIEKVRWLYNNGLNGVWDEIRGRYRYSYNKVSEYIDKVADTLHKYVRRFTCIFRPTPSPKPL